MLDKDLGNREQAMQRRKDAKMQGEREAWKLRSLEAWQIRTWNPYSFMHLGKPFNFSTFQPFNQTTPLPLFLKSNIGKAFGFTLVEVVIVLGILGVVAAATMKITNYIQDLESQSGYKKAVSVASQAILKANTENTLISNTGNNETYTNFLAFMDQFKVLKKCTTNNNSECWDSTGEAFGKNYDTGRPLYFHRAFIDNSGIAWTMLEGNSARIAVDLNGSKKPNQYGKDRFVLYLLSQDGSENSGIPAKVAPWPDNNSNVCTGNVCATQHNYFGTSWLYGK